jgi:SAM-dependent methyltransferase
LLAAKFSYRNTYFHQEPVLDILHAPSWMSETPDFLIWTEVFEHVPAPVSRTFAGGPSRRVNAGWYDIGSGKGSTVMSTNEDALGCSICGGGEFSARPVLWDGLAAEWQLSPDERAYVDRQQGKACIACGGNLRSIALADAILAAAGATTTLKEFAASAAAAALSLLEINEAGTLGPILAGLPGHRLAAYPDVDMHQMPFGDASFDMVVHSDTLEHVSHPIRALAECRRVLKPGGSLCFTVPTIVGRLTRNRAGLARSFHGASTTNSDDFLVHTEFGADMWTFVVAAGFDAVTIHTVAFPDATAMRATKPVHLNRDSGRPA